MEKNNTTDFDATLSSWLGERLQGQRMWELFLSPGPDGNSGQNQRRLMSDAFTEVTSIYYGGKSITYARL